METCGGLELCCHLGTLLLYSPIGAPTFLLHCQQVWICAPVRWNQFGYVLLCIGKNSSFVLCIGKNLAMHCQQVRMCVLCIGISPDLC